MRNNKGKYLPVLIMFLMGTVLALVWGANAQAQTSLAAIHAVPPIQQPLFTEYKGVRLGMTAQEVRTKLGKPALMDNEQDFFVFSDAETVQIGYDAAGKVIIISVDYQNGVGAPGPEAVVGAQLETREDGSLYKVVYYEKQGFWVSYSRTTAGPVFIATITIKKM